MAAEPAEKPKAEAEPVSIPVEPPPRPVEKPDPPAPRRHEIAAIVMVGIGVIWVAIALATHEWLACLLATVCLGPGLILSMRYAARRSQSE